MRWSSLVAIALTLASTGAGAAMYKWTGSDGRVEYGQFPPPGVQAERISASGTTKKVEPQKVTPPEQRVDELEAEQHKQDEQDKEAAEREQRAAQRERNCETARKNLAVLKEEGHHRVRLPDGTVTHLSDEEKQQRIARNEQAIKDNDCQ